MAPASTGGRPTFSSLPRPLSRWLSIFSVMVLSACGGTDEAFAPMTGNASGSAQADAALLPAELPPSPPPPSTAPPPNTLAITTVSLQNLGAASTNIPFTFGQIVHAGQMRVGQGLVGRLPDGTVVPLQADIKATHADGSVRHVIVSGVLPRLAAGQTERMTLLRSSPVAGNAGTRDDLARSNLTASATVTLEGVQYQAQLAQALAAPNAVHWLAGPIADEWIVSAPLRTSTGQEHPLLRASFAVRRYPGLAGQARVDVILENTKTFQAGARNLDYDVTLNVGGRNVYTRQNLKHYHHARWRHSSWWDAPRAPQLHIGHDTDYLVASRAIPNYDQSVQPTSSVLEGFARQLDASRTGPMTIGPLVAYMATTGGRGDIGPLPIWTVSYLLSQDRRALDSMLAAADGSGTWSIHLRDENTGLPLRVDNDANRTISTHMNLAHKGPLPVPRCADKAGTLCQTPYTADTAHQPSLAYLPYLLSGDYYYLEELQFWAAWNPLATDPNNSGRGQGLVRWQQVRGQAWSLRTLGHAAYITPDAHPLKDYFVQQVDNNLAFYQSTYVDANPNPLGMYDGSGDNAFRVTASAPWQDDFLTWSFGHLAELGFSKALPILHWKARYPVGRMTDPGFCWIEASAYHLETRPYDGAAPYSSFAALYQGNFGGQTISNDSKIISHPAGLKFIDQSCGSQAQADWMSAASGIKWVVGRMVGYADSPLGYPANLQPALAIAATYNTTNAAQAWARFDSRAAKQDYGQGPQWAILPRAAQSR